MRFLFLLFGCFALAQLHGQKLVRKAFVGPRTETIQIDSRFCYRIDLKTANTDEVRVSASMEGEYAKDLLVTITENGTTVQIGADFQPLFTDPNDKLSAHKVVSIALQVTVPEYKRVVLFGTNSNVYVAGNYESLKITLSEGMCRLDNVSETVEVTTQKGDIWLTASNGDIKAESAYGHIVKENIPFGDHQFTLKTVEGNIHLMKTK